MLHSQPTHNYSTEQNGCICPTHLMCFCLFWLVKMPYLIAISVCNCVLGWVYHTCITVLQYAAVYNHFIVAITHAYMALLVDCYFTASQGAETA